MFWIISWEGRRQRFFIDLGLMFGVICWRWLDRKSKNRALKTHQTNIQKNHARRGTGWHGWARGGGPYKELRSPSPRELRDTLLPLHWCPSEGHGGGYIACGGGKYSEDPCNLRPLSLGPGGGFSRAKGGLINPTLWAEGGYINPILGAKGGVINPN